MNNQTKQLTTQQQITQMPAGFYTCSKNLGIKDMSLDFTIIYSAVPASAAAVFTKSKFCGAPIPIGRSHVANGQLQCFVINSKNANVATGKIGEQNVQEIIELVATQLDIQPQDILPSSTGVIGQFLPMEKFRQGIQHLKGELVECGLEISAEAIMTTDTYPKMRVCTVGDATLVGIAKGSGMIEPNMATMLAYFVTDAEIPSPVLNRLLKTAVGQSFNMVSVDSDTSTSDTVAMMANGLAGPVDIEEFATAFTVMCTQLAQEIARDGEGATKLIEVQVKEAESFSQAKKVAKSIVNSPLVKTAIFGKDPNWGRVAMAIGKCDDEEAIDPNKITIAFGNTVIYQGGPCVHVSLQEIEQYLSSDTIIIGVSLGIGTEQATVWGCDLSYDYVKINGEYTT